jgi:hypothetical protein
MISAMLQNPLSFYNAGNLSGQGIKNLEIGTSHPKRLDAHFAWIQNRPAPTLGNAGESNDRNLFPGE